jgi:nucleoside-diphosphate-sugar epimerase
MEKILILGGTSFVGRNITQFLADQNRFEITLFNRAISNPTIFKTLNSIQGDRNNQKDIEKIFAKNWDFIIDVSCYFPHQLKPILQGNLKGLSNYIFISTCSVYDNERHQALCRNEKASILPCLPSEEKDESPQSYGKRKAACERILKNSGIPFTILRPALIYGKFDPTDRMYYWLYQIKKEQKILLPEQGKRLFSITYIDDLVQAISKIITLKPKNQVFNCISSPMASIAQIIDVCETVYERTVERVSAPAAFLIEKDIPQWSGIPLWLNSDMFTHSNDKIVQMLSFEPTNLNNGLRETIRYYDTLGYSEPKFGIGNQQKAKLIHALEESQI